MRRRKNPLKYMKLNPQDALQLCKVETIVRLGLKGKNATETAIQTQTPFGQVYLIFLEYGILKKDKIKNAKN